MAEKLRVGIFGRGRLGSAAAALVGSAPDLELAWVEGREAGPRSPVDVALDASAAAAVEAHLAWARDARVDFVIGTTGWPISVLGEAPRESGVMTAPNFSLAVAFARRVALALGRFAALDGAELAVLERHHGGKADAPSGTAKLLAEALVAGDPAYSGWTDKPRESGKIPVASLRAGAEIGYHELRLEGALERIVFSHQALSRELFAQGALRALRWIHGRKGLFAFDDLASELLDGVFAAPGARAADPR